MITVTWVGDSVGKLVDTGENEGEKEEGEEEGEKEGEKEGVEEGWAVGTPIIMIISFKEWYLLVLWQQLLTKPLI